MEKYRYDVYGRQDITESAVGNPYMFTGRRYDPETALYYYRARIYNPHIGRFMQTDPIGYEVGLNLYTYCNNNPVLYTDSTGLWFGLDDAIVSAVGAVGGLVAQGVSDLIKGEVSGWSEYATSALGGVTAAETLLYTGNPFLAGAAGAAVNSGLNRIRDWGQSERDNFGVAGFALDVGIGAAVGGFMPSAKVPGITVGRNSFVAIAKSNATKLANGTIRNVSNKSVAKAIAGKTVEELPSLLTQGLVSGNQRRNDDSYGVYKK